jgi:hypothetical protein
MSTLSPAGAISRWAMPLWSWRTDLHVTRPRCTAHPSQTQTFDGECSTHCNWPPTVWTSTWTTKTSPQGPHTHRPPAQTAEPSSGRLTGIFWWLPPGRTRLVCTALEPMLQLTHAPQLAPASRHARTVCSYLRCALQDPPANCTAHSHPTTHGPLPTTDPPAHTPLPRVAD